MEPSIWDIILGGLAAAAAAQDKTLAVLSGARWAPQAAAVVGAGLAGYGVGTFIDWLYSQLRGGTHSIGSDLYDAYEAWQEFLHEYGQMQKRNWELLDEFDIWYARSGYPDDPHASTLKDWIRRGVCQ